MDNWHQVPNAERVRIGRVFRKKVRKVLRAGGWEGFWRDKLKKYNMMHRFKDVPHWKGIAKRLDDPKDWADVWLISWAMRQLDLSCLFFDQMQGGGMYCGVIGEPEAQTSVLIQWVGHVHFEPLFLHTSGKMETSFPRGHPFMKRLLKMYHNEQCPGATIAIP